MKWILPLSRTAMVFLLAAPLAGCSMALGLNVPHDVSHLLKPGVARADVIAELGPPRKSTIVSSSAKLAQYDDYRVSGLLLVTSAEFSKNDNQWGIYPVAALLTLGVSEVVMLPATAGDLTLRSLHRYGFAARL